MSTTNFPYATGQWPSADVHPSDAQDLLFKAQNFPDDGFSYQTESDLWALQNQEWNDKEAMNPSKDAQSWQLWNNSSLAPIIGKEDNLNVASFWDGQNHQFMNSFQHPNDTDPQQIFSRVAAERALFMTPPNNAVPISTFPGSPVSDLSSATEMSQPTSYNNWDTEKEREEIRASPISDGASDVNSASHSSMTFNWMADCHTQEMQDEDSDPAILEMPDGSTRRSSNWLPVDPEVGFTIGPCSYSEDQKPKDHLYMEDFHDFQQAFISPNSAQWMYTG
ncbi:hypothetical protein N7478_006025 [Penicillium angulare]|uniref:uncharacterized protein n=1 Tax=Penicillium angulare TaxID=116970 RepID=UPI0025424B42|nr:uncharacterized protein N7478_006025 [Penicillium angulare]KAJ5280653.1 hypothetical protein N7478_006025 [Penicillium angulare]